MPRLRAQAKKDRCNKTAQLFLKIGPLRKIDVLPSLMNAPYSEDLGVCRCGRLPETNGNIAPLKGAVRRHQGRHSGFVIGYELELGRIQT
jgi:hypothetical protein